MASLSYQQAGLVLKRPGTGASDAQIRPPGALVRRR